MTDAEETRACLTGWKEIGAYLGRAPRTAQRWEREFGLPVHRTRTIRSETVTAYAAEIDAWLLTSSAAHAKAGGDGPQQLERPDDEPPRGGTGDRRRVPIRLMLGGMGLVVLLVAVGIGMIVRSRTVAIPPTSPLADASALYHLDEGAGSTLKDSNLAQPGRADGRVTHGAWTAGVSGSALDFGPGFQTGRRLTAVLPGTFPFHEPGDVTLSFWMKPLDATHRTWVWSRGDLGGPDANRFHIYTGGSQRLVGPAFGFDYMSPTAAFHLLFEAPITIGDWIHVAVVRVGTVRYVLYLNGERVASVEDTAPQLPDYRGNWALWRTEDNPYPIQNGAIDEIALWTRALTADEVRELARRQP